MKVKRIHNKAGYFIDVPDGYSTKNNDKTIERNSPKLGRNDICRCGSGLKYKKCCGK